MAFGYKILGQAAPADTNSANLYTVPAGTETIVSTIAIANITATDATYDIHVREAGAAISDGNLLVKGATVSANTTTVVSIGVTLSATDIVSVTSGTGSAITYHAFGTEVTA